MNKFAKFGVGGLAVGVAAAALAVIPMTANALPPATVGSDIPVYLISDLDGTQIPENSSLPWTGSALASPDVSDEDYNSNFTTPAGTNQSYVFLSPRGSENTKTAWNAYKTLPVVPTLQLPNLQPSSLTTTGQGTPAGTLAVASAGGDYSIGIAFENSAGTIIESNFVFIEVTGNANPALATYTFATPDAPIVGTEDFTSDIAAPVISGVDGTFTMVAPADLEVVLGAPTLTEGTYGLSKSTGSLGEFSVIDERAVTAPGWYITANVSDTFTGPGTVSGANLGVKPLAADVLPTGASVGAEQLSGSTPLGDWVFAQQSAGVGHYGTTVLDAGLTFIAPAGTAPGTYNGSITLTLVDGEP